MKNNKPEYSIHANADWSGAYYGESLVKYFPSVPNSTIKGGHWYFQINVDEHHPELDLYVFHVNEDLSKINMKNKVKFLFPQKPTFRNIVQRINYVSKFKEYCSTKWRDIYKFLTQPVYKGIILY